MNKRTTFDLVLVFGRHIALYTRDRVNRGAVPKGLYVYELSHDPADENEFHYISKTVRSWFAGTLISNTVIPLPLAGTAEIKDGGDFRFCLSDMRLDNYILCCPPVNSGKGDEENGKPDVYL